MKKFRRKIRSKPGYFTRRGIVCIWVIIVFLLLITTTGLALDVGKVVVVANQLQIVADAAALAGARIVKIDQTQAVQDAIGTALANAADGQNFQLENSDVITGRYNRQTGTFIPTTENVNALKVIARRTDSSSSGPVNLNFGSLFNVDSYNISRSAIALAAGGTGAGLIALAGGGIGLSMNGNAMLNVNDGAVLVNSSAGNAVHMVGNSELQTSELDVSGDIDISGNVELDPEMLLNLGVSPSPDPLCPSPPTNCLPEPSWNSGDDLAPSPGQTLQISGNSVVELEPGYYSGGLRFSGNANVTCKPGIYILDGVGLDISGNARLCAKGVMFYIVGDGAVDITGNGFVEITPIQFDNEDFCNNSYSYPAGIDDAYEDIAIYQARDNTNEAKITGNGNLDLNGTLYFPSNHVKIAGNGDGIGNQLIADTVGISGNGEVTIMYDGRNRTPANRAYLVE